MGRLRPLSLASFAAAVAAATPGCVSTRQPGALVPPTVDQDPRLPQVTIQVAGRSRAIHLVTAGAATHPVLLVLHGSLGDHRALRLFTELADRYRVVLWDQRGNGLSERITSEEYTFDSVVEEIDAVKAMFSPDAPVTLLGHSFGAMYSALYMSRRPEAVDKAVLIEPGGLNGKIMQATFRQVIAIDLLDHGLNEAFWQSEFLSPADHEAMDYKALQVLLNGKLTRYHCDPERPMPMPLWRPGAHIEAMRYVRMGPRFGSFDYDFAAGLETFPRRVLLVGSDCSALGYDFQVRHHQPLFHNAEVLEIREAGHRLMVEQPAALLAAVRRFLAAD